jgi:hypothetical protein
MRSFFHSLLSSEGSTWNICSQSWQTSAMKTCGRPGPINLHMMSDYIHCGWAC